MVAPSTPVPTVRANGEGEHRWFYGGGVHTRKATAEATAGAFLLFEMASTAEGDAAAHHPDSDETMYVLDSELLMHIDGHQERIGPRGLAIAPRGVRTPSR